MAKRRLKKWGKSLFIFVPPKKEVQASADESQIIFPSATMLTCGDLGKLENLTSESINIKLRKLKRLILVFSSNDINVLQIECPQLSKKNLELALPNLAEEYLLTKLDETSLVPGNYINNRQTIYVLDKIFLTQILDIFRQSKIKSIYFLSDQVGIPDPDSNQIYGRLLKYKKSNNISIKTEINTILSVSLDNKEIANFPEKLIQIFLKNKNDKNLSLDVPASFIVDYQKSIDAIYNAREKISLKTYDWNDFLVKAYANAVTLSSVISKDDDFNLDSSKWKIPAIATLLLIIINTTAINWKWMQMKEEIKISEAFITREFKNYFPKETVMLDPIKQMRQKINYIDNSNLLDQNNFYSLIVGFSEFRETLSKEGDSNSVPAVVAIEYRNKILYVHFEPNQNSILATNRNLLDELGLYVTESSSKSKGIIWKISGIK